jgi:AAA+ superfamily predicted ATPase
MCSYVSGDVDVTGLHATVFQEDPLCDLILSSTNRAALESALSIFRHPHHSTVHRSAPGPTIVLLHGGPGVGKTTTARSSAEHLRLPLLEVSTGDIARQGNGSQEAFHQLLTNANRWGAVLSLEDAHMLFPDHNVEFEERHYSALLMIEALEAHSGLLFLVTDRIGMFSGALRTRVNIAIRLPKLDGESQLKLFRNLVSKIDGGVSGSLQYDQGLFQKELIDAVTGWDISTAVTTAVQLAISKGESLTWEHFAYVFT